MKKLVLLLGLLVVTMAVKEVFNFFEPMTQAYRSYRKEAEANVLGEGKTGRFRAIEGAIIRVNYRLESADLATETEVHLVVVESVRFRKASERLSNRRVAQTRQRVLMRFTDGRWTRSELDLIDFKDY